MDLDGLAPFLEGALVVSAEQYAPLRTLLADLMWDREVLAAVPQTVPDPREAVPQLVDALQRSPFARWLRPGCDSYELEAHAMMLGRPLPRELRTLLGAIGGMEAMPLAPTLTLAGHGYRLLGPGEAQQQHAEWTRRRDDPQQQAGGTTHPAQAWDTDWLPVAPAAHYLCGDLVTDLDGATSLPGLYVYLTNNPSTVNNAYEIGRVETFNGAHSYRISGVGLNEYDYLLYWCKPFSVKVGDGEIK